MIQTVDIIIPTYKPGEKFLRLLGMLKKQTFPYNRLIVINTECHLMPNGLRAELDADESCILKDISREEFDHAATRTMGVRVSHADVFICMTDDAVPYDEFLIEKLVSALEADESTAIAYARQLAAEDADEAERFTRIFNYPDKSRKKTIADLDELGVKTFFASDVCCAYKRNVFDELGGFVESAGFNEDMLYAARALRAGYSSVYAAEAKVIHSHNYTAMQQLHRNFDLGMSQKMHPEVFGGLSSEGEGMKLVKGIITHLKESGHTGDIPRFIIRTGFRYLGYRLGKLYDRLPDCAVVALSLNKVYVRKVLAARRTDRK